VNRLLRGVGDYFADTGQADDVLVAVLRQPKVGHASLSPSAAISTGRGGSGRNRTCAFPFEKAPTGVSEALSKGEALPLSYASQYVTLV